MSYGQWQPSAQLHLQAFGMVHQYLTQPFLKNLLPEIKIESVGHTSSSSHRRLSSYFSHTFYLLLFQMKV